MKKFSESETFCIYPFTHLNVKANGHMTLCNRCAPLERITEKTDFKTFWNSKRVTNIREQVLSGVRPKECVACWNLEDSGATSYRQEALSPTDVHYEWLEKNEARFRQKIYDVKEIELRFGNLCNLKCKMCSPKFSSRWEKELKTNAAFKDWMIQDPENRDIYELEKNLTDEQMAVANKRILDSLEELSDSIEYVMYSGGEPLLQRDHYLSLEKLLPNADKITLEYTSNLNYLNFEKYDVLNYWKKFKKVIVKVSIDADPLLYDYIREGGSLSKVEQNILRIKEAFDPEDLVLIGTCTTSIYNIARLPEIMSYFWRLDVIAHTSLVEYPTFLSPQILPPGIKAEVASRVEAYLARLDQELPQNKLSQDDFLYRRERTRKWMANCLKYTMGSDESWLWPHFLKFNSFWDKGNHRLFSFYPDWRRFC